MHQSYERNLLRVRSILGEELLDSSWMRRLDRISFLGPLDGHSRSRKKYSRLEHSLGVATLGLQVADSLELSEPQRFMVVVACALHDIGHYPLSHTAESAFKKALGVNHHDLSRWIIRGEGEIGEERSLRPILEQNHLDADLLWELIDSASNPAKSDAADDQSAQTSLGVELAFLLSGPINLDTLDGIHRVARAFRLRAKTLPDQIFCWSNGSLALHSDAMKAVDAFWLLKDRVYERVINLPSNILAEARLCEWVTRSATPKIFERLELFDDLVFWGQYRRGRESERAQNEALSPEHSSLPSVDAALNETEDQDYELQSAAGWGKVLVRMRKRYFVDSSVQPQGEALPVYDWARRYRNEREPAFLVSKREQLELPLAYTPPTFESPEI